MTLRDELLALEPETVRQAILATMDTDPAPQGTDIDALVEHYGKLLAEYPALELLFRNIASTAMSVETTAEIKLSSLTSAGVALVGIKAAANRQVFGDLEIPPDLR